MTNKRNLKKKQLERPVNKLALALLSPWTIGLLGALAFAAYSVAIGQSVKWDLLNYHYYISYAFCQGRLDQDILAAQLQTYFDPALYIPFYLGTTLTNPVTLGFIIGLVQGLNLVLVYIIARRLLSCPPAGEGSYIICSLVSLGIAAIGTTAPLFLSETGTFAGDNLTSIPVLAGIALAFCMPKPQKWYIILIGGLLMGAATGLKLTNAMFILGMFICAWWYDRRLTNSIFNVVLFSCGCTLGLLLVYGWWGIYLWQEYGNPLFPFYNAIFQSPYYGLHNFKDIRFPPDNLAEALSYPFQWAVGQHPSAEVPFRDLRFALISILIIPAAIIACLRSIRSRTMPLRANNLSMLAFFLSCYIIWIAMFAIQRYAVVLELLTGLVIYLLLELIVSSSKLRPLIFIPLILVMVLTTVPADWGRTSWGPSWFGVSVPAQLTATDEMFIMLTGEPYSYIIPSFPADSRFIRIEGNLNPAGTKFEDKIRRAIAEHSGPLYAIGIGALTEKQIKLMAGYGLSRSDTEITVMSSKVHPAINIYRLRYGAQVTAGSTGN